MSSRSLKVPHLGFWPANRPPLPTFPKVESGHGVVALAPRRKRISRRPPCAATTICHNKIVAIWLRSALRWDGRRADGAPGGGIVGRHVPSLLAFPRIGDEVMG